MNIKSLILLLIITIGSNSIAKMLCQIEIANPRESLSSNSKLNTQLKPHQKLKEIKLELDLNLDALALKAQAINVANEIKVAKVYFKTKDNKNFESIYEPYNNRYVWKFNFSKSRIFPDLTKKYVNLVEHNSMLLFRMYDAVDEQNQIHLIFEKRDCVQVMPNKMLTGAR